MSAFYWIDTSVTIFSAMSSSALALFVLGLGPRQTLNRLFALFIAMGAFWSVTGVLFRLSLIFKFGNQLFWLELATICFALMGPSLLLFTVRYVKVRKAWFDVVVALGFIAIGVLGIPVFRHQIIFNPHLGENGLPSYEISVLGYMVALVPLIYMAWSSLLFWRERHRTGEPYMALGVSIITAGSIVGPLLRPFIPFPASNVAIALSIIILAYGIISRQLFNPLRERTSELERQIAERKLAEKELRKSEEKYKNLFENAPVGYMEYDSGGRITKINRKELEMLGYAAEEILGEPAWSFSTKKEKGEKLIKAKLAGNRTPSKNLEMTYIRKDGSTFPGLINDVVFRDGEGKIIGIRSTIQDITERKRAEEDQMKLQAQLSNTLEMAHLGPWEYDVAGDIFTFNDYFYKIFRTTVDQVGGYTMSPAEYAERFLHPDDIHVVGEEVRKAIEATDPNYSRQLEHRIIYADGTVGHITVRFFIVKDAKGQTVRTYGVNQDITERKRAEEELRREKEFTDMTLDAQLDTFFLFEPATGKALRWNRTFKEISGYTDEEIARMPAPASYYGPEDLKRAEVFIQKVLEKGTGTIELELISKNGRKIPTEYRVSVIKDDQKDSQYIISIGRDITDRVQAEKERRRLETQLQQAQKMESIGTLAGGIAHDFNNSLQGILGYTQILLLNMPKDAPEVGKLRQIEEAALRASELTQQLLTFSRKVESKLRPVDLNREVRQAEKLLRRTIPRMIDIELHLESDLKIINADAAQIEQVIMNLGINARDAMPDGGKLAIKTENVVLDETYCRTHLETVPGDYVKLSISDSGTGMDKEVLEYIFEPFYTTKNPGEGTGLGLAMVYGIVKNHGANITCHSEHGEGTIFRIYFPVVEEARLRRLEHPEKADIRGGTETILLVDDDELIHEIAQEMLCMFGYTVLSAANGEKALEIYRENKEDISLVILDLIMPGMGGQKCLKEILKINPSQKVVIASGYFVDDTTEKVLKRGAKGFIKKPFEVEPMLSVVREVLDRK